MRGLRRLLASTGGRRFSLVAMRLRPLPVTAVLVAVLESRVLSAVHVLLPVQPEPAALSRYSLLVAELHQLRLQAVLVVR